MSVEKDRAAVAPLRMEEDENGAVPDAEMKEANEPANKSNDGNPADGDRTSSAGERGELNPSTSAVPRAAAKSPVLDDELTKEDLKVRIIDCIQEKDWAGVIDCSNRLLETDPNDIEGIDRRPLASDANGWIPEFRIGQ